MHSNKICLLFFTKIFLQCVKYTTQYVFIVNMQFSQFSKVSILRKLRKGSKLKMYTTPKVIDPLYVHELFFVAMKKISLYSKQKPTEKFVGKKL